MDQSRCKLSFFFRVVQWLQDWFWWSSSLAFTCWGFQFCRRTQSYCSVYPLKRNQDPAARLNYCFLTVPLLSLYPLLFMMSNYLNLPFGTQGRSWRFNEAYFLQTRNGGEKFSAQEPHRVLLSFKIMETKLQIKGDYCIYQVFKIQSFKIKYLGSSLMGQHFKAPVLSLL